MTLGAPESLLYPDATTPKLLEPTGCNASTSCSKQSRRLTAWKAQEPHLKAVVEHCDERVDVGGIRPDRYQYVHVCSAGGTILSLGPLANPLTIVQGVGEATVYMKTEASDPATTPTLGGVKQASGPHTQKQDIMLSDAHHIFQFQTSQALHR